jgi:hypothetical protein
MKYFVEESLSNFNFWSGGKDRAELLTDEQFDTVEQMMEEIEPAEGWTDTAINDFFWFDFDTIAQWLGYADEAHLEKDITQSEVQEAQEWAEDRDWDQATEDFMDWWNCMDDIDQVEEYRKYQ